MNQKLRISSGLVLHSVPTGDVLDYMRKGFDFHKEIGFDAVDLSLNLYTNLMGDQVEKAAEAALQYSHKIGLPIELCHLPFRTDDDHEPDEHFSIRMRRAIDCAKLLGVQYAAIHPESSTLPLEGYNEQAQYDRAMKALAPAADYAAKAGVNLALENMRPLILKEPFHRYCQNPEELCRVADETGIGVCWDFGHAHIAGLKQSEALAYVGKRLKMLHVNDNHGALDVHLSPWLGTIDWADAMKGLSDIGFDGLFNYELIAARVPQELREDYARYAMAAAHRLVSML